MVASAVCKLVIVMIIMTYMFLNHQRFLMSEVVKALT